MVKIIFILLFSLNVFSSEEFAITRVNANFNQTWYSLYDKVKKAGYTTAYLQRCDAALKQRHYKTDKYRILFFGEYQNMEYLSRKYPKIVPYLPLKIVVMAEEGNTLLINNPPHILLELVDKKDVKIINKWQDDLKNIFKKVKQDYIKDKY